MVDHRQGHVLWRPWESPGILEELQQDGKAQACDPMLVLDQWPFSRGNSLVFPQFLKMPGTFHPLPPPRRRALHTARSAK
jgi:hypothetical protein